MFSKTSLIFFSLFAGLAGNSVDKRRNDYNGTDSQQSGCKSNPKMCLRAVVYLLCFKTSNNDGNDDDDDDDDDDGGGNDSGGGDADVP